MLNLNFCWQMQQNAGVLVMQRTHYNNGVLAAITQLSAYGDAGVISDDDAQNYLDAHPYDDANGLDMINTQFWAATFFNEYEAWSNYRRTGYPVLVPVNYPGSQSPRCNTQKNAIFHS